MQTWTNIVAAGLLFVSTSSQATIALHNATEADVRQLDGAVMTFGLEHGRYPSQSEGLSLLVTGFPGETAKDSGYIKVLRKDWWGRDYVYRFPSLHNTNGPDIYSLGEDGISKTGGNDPDDINNWSEGRPWSAYYSRPSLRDRLVPWFIGWGIVSMFAFLCLVGRNERPSSAHKPSRTAANVVLLLCLFLATSCANRLKSKTDLDRLTERRGMGTLYYIGSEDGFHFFATKYFLEPTKYYRLPESEYHFRNKFPKTKDTTKWIPYTYSLKTYERGFHGEPLEPIPRTNGLPGGAHS